MIVLLLSHCTDDRKNMSMLTSLVGIIVLLAIAILMSDNRRAINFRTFGSAIGALLAVGTFFLYLPIETSFVVNISNAFDSLIFYGHQGTHFLFGDLVNDSKIGLGFIFAFRILPLIIFFSALVSVLFYLGIMQLIINVVGGILKKILGISRAEALSATANIFVGYIEAPLIVRPFLSQMTQSELFSVMVVGMASISGSALVAFSLLNVPIEYLIAASIMSAPSGLLVAKIIKPETDTLSDKVTTCINSDCDDFINIFEAAASGASSGLQLALNVGAVLLAFIGLIALLNGVVGYIGHGVGVDNLTIELILGYIFSPIAFLIGVPWDEAHITGSLIGQKLVFNALFAYQNLSPYLVDVNTLYMSEKAKVVTIFALCGFANLPSIAVLIGGLGNLVPNRRSDIVRMGMKALMAATLANLISAGVAGLFFSQ